MTHRGYDARLAKLEAQSITPGTNAETEQQRALMFAIMSNPETRASVMEIYGRWARHLDATHDGQSWPQACQAFFESANQ